MINTTRNRPTGTQPVSVPSAPPVATGYSIPTQAFMANPPVTAPPSQPPPYGATTPYGQPPMMNPPQYGPTPPPQYGPNPPQYGPNPSQFGGVYPQQPQYPGRGYPPLQPSYQPQYSPYPQAGGPSPYAQPMGVPAMGMGMAGGVVSLSKGGNMSLSKAVPNLRQVTIGLGWDVRQTPGAPFDLDASVFLLKADGRVRMAQDLIFYNNLKSVDGSVWHHGDNLTGAGEGDDEQISVDLTRVPPEIQKIVVVVSIYEAEVRQQNFGMVSRAFIRVFNAETNQEIVRYDLTEEASLLSCMIFGELYRYNNEWKFRAIGQGLPGGLKACGPMYGIMMQ